MIFKLLVFLTALWFADTVYSLVKHYLEYRRPKQAGAIFMQDSFNPIGDM